MNKLDHESKSGLEGSEDSLKQVTNLVGTVKDWVKDGFSPKELPKAAQVTLKNAHEDLVNGQIDRDQYNDILSDVKNNPDKKSKGFIDYVTENAEELTNVLGANTFNSYIEDSLTKKGKKSLSAVKKLN